MSFRRQTGGLDLTGIRISEPLHIEFSTKERARDTRAIGKLILSGSDPPRITGFALLAIPPGNPTIIGFSIDAQTRDRVIDHAIAQLQDSYVSPEVAKQMGEALRRHHLAHLAEVRNDYTNPYKEKGPIITQLRTLGIDGEGAAALPAVEGYDDSTGVGSPDYYIQSFWGY